MCLTGPCLFTLLHWWELWKGAITELLPYLQLMIARPSEGCYPSTCFVWDKKWTNNNKQKKNLRAQCTLNGTPLNGSINTSQRSIFMPKKQKVTFVQREEILECNVCVLVTINFTECGWTQESGRWMASAELKRSWRLLLWKPSTNTSQPKVAQNQRLVEGLLAGEDAMGWELSKCCPPHQCLQCQLQRKTAKPAVD